MTNLIRNRRTLWLTAGVLAAGLLTSCGVTDDEGRPLTTLSPKGEQAQKIYDLSVPIFLVAGVVFVFVQVAVVFVAIRYRRRRTDVEGVDEPVQRHGNAPLEWGWTILPALLLAGLAIGNVKTIWDLESDHENAPMEVEVIGQQWWWEFRYDTNDDGEPDIITANQLVIPAGTTVRLRIQSNDVIHSFWIPTLSGKKDAVPGRIHNWAITAEEPGIYEGQCTEYCGLSHAYMRMQVKALSDADYQTWVDNQLAPAVEPPEGTEAAQGREIFFQKCASCHQINGFDSTGEPTGEGADPDYGGALHPLIAGNAPNLTHLMSRDKFAGGMFDLFLEDATHEAAIPEGESNAANLSDWLRDPPGMKPMAPEGNRGMPNLNLPEDEIRQLVAYLTSLK